MLENDGKTSNFYDNLERDEWFCEIFHLILIFLWIFFLTHSEELEFHWKIEEQCLTYCFQEPVISAGHLDALYIFENVQLINASDMIIHLSGW